MKCMPANIGVPAFARRCDGSGLVAEHVHRRPTFVRRHPAFGRLRGACRRGRRQRAHPAIYRPHSPKALIATPSLGRHLIEECSKIAGKPASRLGLNWFFCAGEPGGGDPEIRTILAEGFGAKVFDHTGGGHAFHGISCDCPAGDYYGMHFVSEDHCLLELVDPHDRSPVTIADGAVGEMVWTFLDWRGAPFMRYAMGDVAQIWTAPCPCGMPGSRFKIIGRADDMLIVKGRQCLSAGDRRRLGGLLSARDRCIPDRPRSAGPPGASTARDPTGTGRGIAR